MLPYWEGVPHEAAVDYVVDKMQRLEEAFPNKKIVIAEVGWPSDGRTRDQAVASVPNEASFLRRFLARAQEEGYVYYLMEAFDQPWKANDYEGAVGAYWGVYDAFRQPKFEFTDADRPRAAVAPARRHLGRARGAAARHLLQPQQHARLPRPHLPRAGGLRDRNGGRVDHLRLLAAVPHADRRC